MECLLASIFDEFWWFFGANLGAKIENKSILKGIEKMIKNECDLKRFRGGYRKNALGAAPPPLFSIFKDHSPEQRRRQ